jgi:hypothetical protein
MKRGGEEEEKAKKIKKNMLMIEK